MVWSAAAPSTGTPSARRSAENRSRRFRHASSALARIRKRAARSACTVQAALASRLSAAAPASAPFAAAGYVIRPAPMTTVRPECGSDTGPRPNFLHQDADRLGRAPPGPSLAPRRSAAPTIRKARRASSIFTQDVKPWVPPRSFGGDRRCRGLAEQQTGSFAQQSAVRR